MGYQLNKKQSYNGSRIPQQDLFLRFQGFITSHQFCVCFIGFQQNLGFISFIIITFKAIHGQAPVYLLQELISKREEKRYNLRSCAMGIMLQTPITLTKKTLGDRAFLAAAPKLWNGLPSQIRNEPNFHRFKGLLKTHFFRLAFYFILYFYRCIAFFIYNIFSYFG